MVYISPKHTTCLFNSYISFISHISLYNSHFLYCTSYLPFSSHVNHIHFCMQSPFYRKWCKNRCRTAHKSINSLWKIICYPFLARDKKNPPPWSAIQSGNNAHYCMFPKDREGFYRNIDTLHWSSRKSLSIISVNKKPTEHIYR
mgnify:CR=1 FL=1